MQMSGAAFWLRWVAANAVGEVLGLLPAALVGVVLARVLAESGGAGPALGAMLVFSVLGACEGAVVGLAQWIALRRRLSGVTRRAWVLATLVGAVAAWILRMLPSTLASLLGGSMDPGGMDFEGPKEYALAAAMGAGLGLVLALPQWRILRRFVDRSAWWLPANALGWGLAMPLVFAAAGLPLPQDGLLPLLAAIIGTIAFAGALVGAVHGAVLVWLTRGGRRA